MTIENKVRLYRLNNVGVVVFLSLAFWLCCIVLGYVDWEQNDDVAMNLIAVGAYGYRTPYLVFVDYIFGALIYVLYSIFPGVNCYLWTFLVLNFLSVIVISYILSEKLSLIKTVAVTLALNCLMSYDFYLKLEFTKNAMLYSVVGAIILLWQIFFREKIKWGGTIIGGLFIFMGFCVRRQSFLMTVPFIVGSFFVFLFDALKQKKISKEKMASVAIAIAIPVLLCLVSLIVNWYCYKCNASWDEYWKINGILVEKRDYWQYYFVDAPEEYLDAGITELDMELLGNWTWNDPEMFSLNNLEKIAAVGERFRTDKIEFYKEIIWEISGRIADVIRNNGIAFMFAVLVFLSVITDNRTRVIVLCCLGTLLLGYFYIVCRGRYAWHAEICVWLPAVIFSAFAIMQFFTSKYQCGNDSEMSIYSKVMTCVQIILIIALAFSWQFYQFYTEKNYSLTVDDSAGYEMFQNIKDSDAFFVIHMKNAGRYWGAKNIFDVDCKYTGLYTNSTYLGAWLIPTPLAVEAYQKFGIENPIKDLIKDNVYCVADEDIIDLLHSYLEETYQYNLTEVQVEVDGVSAWKFSLLE